MVKTDAEYDQFEYQLQIDFSKITIKDKTHLRELLYRKNYRRKKIPETGQVFKEMPTQTQIEYAWEYMTKKFPFFKWEKDPLGRLHLYAKKNVYVRGKLYKTGQYVPKTKVLIPDRKRTKV